MHLRELLLLCLALILTGCGGAVTRLNRTDKVPVSIEKVRTFGSTYLLSPISICTDIQGYVYVGDQASVGVHKFSPDFDYQMAFGDFGQSESQLLAPVDLFCDGFYIYVVDGRQERIAKYDRYGGFLRLFVPVGTDTLGSGYPVAIALSPAGEMYVLETRPGQVLALDEYGRSKSVFGRLGGAAGLSTPTSIAIGPQSEIYVSDAGSRRLVIYDVFGAYLGQIGGMVSPSDVVVDKHGNIYVSDPVGGTVTCYDRQGRSLASLAGLSSPRALALADENTLLVVDSENGSVAVCRIRYE